MGLKIKGMLFIYPGTTRLLFNEAGLIRDHRDYFDFVGPTFAPVPVVGVAIAGAVVEVATMPMITIAPSARDLSAGVAIGSSVEDLGPSTVAPCLDGRRRSHRLGATRRTGRKSDRTGARVRCENG